MEEKKIDGNTSKRIIIIDSLRGFSLFGILISHLSIFFEALDFSTVSSPNASLSNIVVSVINGILFSGKYFAIFSFLFGLSFYIQMDRAAQKGINYRWRFLWRILILMVVGYIHSLLFSGDILIIYAMLGVFLVFLFNVSNKVLIFLIIVLLSGIPRYISYGIQNIPGGEREKIENKRGMRRDEAETPSRCSSDRDEGKNASAMLVCVLIRLSPKTTRAMILL